MTYFRLRGDYFRAKMVKAKSFTLIGLTFSALNDIVLPVNVSLFLGSLFLAIATWFVIQATNVKRQQDRGEAEPG